VGNAWAGFGAAFGPVIILSLYWKRMTLAGAISGMLVGATTVLVWIYAPITINGESLGSHMYEIVPGFILCTLTILLVSHFTEEPKGVVIEQFDEMSRQVNQAK